jgi:glycine/sarcosine N-methyltransferase
MPNPARRLYDRLARDYHLIYADWNAAIESQSRAIDRIVRSEVAAPPLALLDCACGIGTQAIGLALRGYQLHATDLSRPALQRARREARSRGAQLTFAQADLRDLGRRVASTFDVVICCDNSLAHMITARDLARAARSIKGRLKPRGLFIASIRDYDRIVREHPTFTPQALCTAPGDLRLAFQHWKWHRDGRTYDQHLFIVRGRGDRWTIRHYRGLSHAFLRSELSEHLRRVGLRKVKWLMPAQTGYHQPIVIARAPMRDRVLSSPVDRRAK